MVSPTARRPPSCPAVRAWVGALASGPLLTEARNPLCAKSPALPPCRRVQADDPRGLDIPRPGAPGEAMTRATDRPLGVKTQTLLAGGAHGPGSINPRWPARLILPL